LTCVCLSILNAVIVCFCRTITSEPGTPTKHKTKVRTFSRHLFVFLLHNHFLCCFYPFIHLTLESRLYLSLSLSHSSLFLILFFLTCGISTPRLIIKKTLQSSAGISISLYRSSSLLQTLINTESQKHTHIAKLRRIIDLFLYKDNYN